MPTELRFFRIVSVPKSVAALAVAPWRSVLFSKQFTYFIYVFNIFKYSFFLSFFHPFIILFIQVSTFISSCIISLVPICSSNIFEDHISTYSAIGWVMIAYSSNCLISQEWLASIAEGDSIINATLLTLLYTW